MSDIKHLFPHITKLLGIANDTLQLIDPIQDFANGVLLYPMLKKMRIQCQIYQTPTFLQSFNNLKHIHSAVIKQAAEYKLYNIVEQELNLMKISKEKDIEEMCKLFLCCQALALSGENKQYFINNMQKLSQEVQSQFISKLSHFMQKQTLSEDKIILHKIAELQNQNHHLQQIIKNLILQQQEQKTTINILQERIANYEEVEDHSQSKIVSPKHIKEHSERKSLTPTRSITDSMQRYEMQITNLQLELQFYKNNESSLESLKSQCQQYKLKYEQTILKNNNIIKYQNQVESLQKIIKQKQKVAQTYKTRCQNLSKQNEQLHNISIKDGINMKLLNIKVSQLQKQLDNFRQQKQKQQQNYRKPLSDICPEVNTQLYHLKDQNQSLLNTLQKSTSKIKMLEKELDRFKRENHRLSSLERQNKKLEQILMDYSNNRGEENDILVGCLYELRMKFNSSVLNAPTKFKSVVKFESDDN